MTTSPVALRITAQPFHSINKDNNPCGGGYSLQYHTHTDTLLLRTPSKNFWYMSSFTQLPPFAANLIFSFTTFNRQSISSQADITNKPHGAEAYLKSQQVLSKSRYSPNF